MVTLLHLLLILIPADRTVLFGSNKINRPNNVTRSERVKLYKYILIFTQNNKLCYQ
jgi:hypothetical protein